MNESSQPPVRFQGRAIALLFAIIGVVFLLGAAALIVFSKATGVAGTPLVAGLVFLATAAWWARRRT
jgi:hypothetical protein